MNTVKRPVLSVNKSKHKPFFRLQLSHARGALRFLGTGASGISSPLAASSFSEDDITFRCIPSDSRYSVALRLETKRAQITSQQGTVVVADQSVACGDPLTQTVESKAPELGPVRVVIVAPFVVGQIFAAFL